SRRLLLPGLRAAPRRSGGSLAPTAGLQLPAAKRAVTLAARLPEPALPTAAQGVPDLRASSRSDARGSRGARPRPHLRAPPGRVADRGIPAPRRDLTAASRQPAFASHFAGYASSHGVH